MDEYYNPNNQLDEIKNDGFQPPEKDYKDTDWLAGSELSGIVYEEVLLDGNWRKYKPRNEDQNHAGNDKMCCVSSSFTNTVEEQINKMIKDDLLDLEKLEPWLENGLLNTSERHLAKGSGTTTSGNSQPRVVDYARKNGLVPEKLWKTPPASEYMSWAEYYKTIPADILKWGEKFLEYFDIMYERLPDSTPATLRKHMKQAPIWWATFTCSGWGSADIIKACSTSPNHATIGDCYDDLKWWGDLDHYDPYEKKLAWNYKIYYPYKVLVVPKPAILKKKPSEDGEGENMKIEINVVKKKNTPDFLYEDKMKKGVWHRFGDAETYMSQCGEFPKNPDELDIANENIESPIYLAPSIWRVLAFALGDFFNKLRGK